MIINTLSTKCIREPLSNDYRPLLYGYVDESGDTAPFSSQPLIIIGVFTENPRKLEVLCRRLYKTTGIRIKNREIKAAQLKSIYIVRILESLIYLPVFIHAIEVDKPSIKKPPRFNEEIYGKAICSLFRSCLYEYPRVEWHLDKRFNNRNKQLWLERYIRDELVNFSGVSYTIIQEDSTCCKPLQIADIVAWSFGQYKKGISIYRELIEKIVVKYEMLQIEKWE